MLVEAKRRGLASTDSETLRRVTSLGGKAAHAMGKGHTWTSEEAQKAGRAGGKVLKGSKWSRLRYRTQRS